MIWTQETKKNADSDPKHLECSSRVGSSVADPKLWSGAFLTPGSGSGMGKKKNQDPDWSGMNIPDHIYESLETIFGSKMFEFFDADPDPGSGIFWPWIWDPGWTKFGYLIRDKQPGSATTVGREGIKVLYSGDDKTKRPSTVVLYLWRRKW
jgi:hypothetical protein